MTERRVDLLALFRDLQAELEAKLGTARRNIDHSTAKGGATEEEWRSLLVGYLPRRYSVTTGFVLAADGRRSDQIDIIIHDRHFSPLLFHQAHACYVPAESVYAVFEVKPDLSRENVLYAGAKTESVRGLARTSTAIRHAGGEYQAKKPDRILAGLLTTSSSWSPGLGEPLDTALRELDEAQQIDLGCAATVGAFRTEYGSSLLVRRSSRDEALVYFTLHLHRLLQAMASPPAMDFAAYASALQET